jgi:dihydrofolate synthase/folylpolyglutamate synthase
VTLEEVAERVGAELISYEREWSVTIENEGFYYHSKQQPQFFPAPALEGKHQFYNAATAVACVKALPQFNISNAQLWQGLTQAKWPGRLHPLTQGPLAEMLREGDELWLDGGHNPGAGEALAGWIKRNKKQPLYMICGMTALKDTDAFLAPLAPHVQTLCAITIPGEDTSKNATEVAESASKLGIKVIVLPDLSTGLGYILGQSSEKAVILIAGSLYLAGYVLRENN